MQAALEKANETIARNTVLSEEGTKLALIVPILRKLGWRDDDSNEFRAEFGAGDGRVDYALCRGDGRPAIFVEAKKVGFEDEPPEVDEDQLVGYLDAYRRTTGDVVPLGVLTDGKVWGFYLGEFDGSTSDRRFYLADLEQREKLEEYAEAFERFLQKDNVLSGKALEAAKAPPDLPADAMSSAWQGLLQESDTGIGAILTIAVERECGIRPEWSDIAEFLQRLAAVPAPFPAPPQPGDTNESSIPSGIATPGVVPTNRRRIVGFVLDGRTVETGAGNRTLAEVLKALQSRDPEVLPKLDSQTRGPKNRLVAQDRNDLFKERGFVRKLSTNLQNGWWMRTNHGNPAIEDYIKRACEIAGVSYGSQLTLKWD